ncbi:MAG: EamA family transporter [Nitrospirae bacterium]|nr:EamA family transporter [Nitrospirota bacterium]
MLKIGANCHHQTQGLNYYIEILSNKWVITGIMVHVAEMVIWILILKTIPLSVAFPLTGFQKIFVIFFSYFVLKENITKSEWVGIGFISSGLMIIIGEAFNR